MEQRGENTHQETENIVALPAMESDFMLWPGGMQSSLMFLTTKRNCFEKKVEILSNGEKLLQKHNGKILLSQLQIFKIC